MASRRSSKRERAPAPAPAAEVELEQVDKGGMGIDEGIMIATFVLLVGAIVLVYLAGQQYLPAGQA